MANKIYFLRSSTIYPSLDSAKLKLSQLSSLKYGEPVVVRYLSGSTVKQLLAVGTGMTDNPVSIQGSFDTIDDTYKMISDINKRVGDTDDLTTNHKIIVNAINEVKDNIIEVADTRLSEVKSGDAAINVSKFDDTKQYISLVVDIEGENLASVEDSGLSVKADLKYNSEESTISIVDRFGTKIGLGAKIPSRFLLNSEACRYDPKTEELVLVSTDDNGVSKIVRISLKDLIEEYDVMDTDSIDLNKIRTIDGKSQLTAQLRIDKYTENNALSESVHGVYVRNLQPDIDQIHKELNDLENGENSIDNRIENAINDLKGDVSYDYATLERIENQVKKVKSDSITKIKAGENIIVSEKQNNSVTITSDTIDDSDTELETAPTNKSFSSNKVLALLSEYKVKNIVGSGSLKVNFDDNKNATISLGVDNVSIKDTDSGLSVDLVDGGVF